MVFASATENVSLIGGGGILASSMGLFLYLLRVWAKENTRQRHLTVSESERADRAEYRLGIAGDLLDINGIQRPANFWQWPPAQKELT